MILLSCLSVSSVSAGGNSSGQKGAIPTNTLEIYSGGARALRQVRHWSSDSNIDYGLPPDTNYEKAKRRTKCNHLSLGFDFHIVGQYPVGGSALNYFRLLIYEIFTVEDPSSQHHVNQTYEISAWLASIGNVKWPNSSLWAVRQSLTAQQKSGLF